MTIGSKIFELRKKCNLSQEELAEKLHVSRQTISKWENDVVLPDVYNLKELAKVFHCTVDEVIDEDKHVHVKSDGPVVEAMKYGGSLVKRHWQKIGYYLVYTGLGSLFASFLISLFSHSTQDSMNVFETAYDMGTLPVFRMYRIISAIPLVIGFVCLTLGICLIIYDFRKMRDAK